MGNEILTDEQDRAIALAVSLGEWTGTPRIVAWIGFAGTGKSWCLKHLGEEVDDMFVVAPTGKAALRVRQLTQLQAATFHSWAYFYDKEAQKRGDDPYSLRPLNNPNLDEPETSGVLQIPACGFLPVDEASMLSRRMWKDLYFLALHGQFNILLIGDGFQLPPVQDRSEEPFSVFAPAFLKELQVEVAPLTKIHRQAEGSVIIQATLRLRPVSQGGLGDPAGGLKLLKTIKQDQLLEAATQVHEHDGTVVCYTNKTRHAINYAVRSCFGYDAAPARGEPFLVMRNCPAIDRFNGEVITFEEWLSPPGPWAAEHYKFLPVPERVHFQAARVDGHKVIICPEQLFGRTHAPDWLLAECAESWATQNDVGLFTKDVATGEEKLISLPFLSVNLGWAATAHKMQGSQSPFVLFVMEWMVSKGLLDSEEMQRLVYTSLTRAEKEVVICPFNTFKPLGQPRRRATLKAARPPTYKALFVPDDPVASGELAAKMGDSAHLCFDRAATLVATETEAAQVMLDYDGLVLGRCEDGREAGVHEVEGPARGLWVDALKYAAWTAGKTVLAWRSGGNSDEGVAGGYVAVPRPDDWVSQAVKREARTAPVFAAAPDVNGTAQIPAQPIRPAFMGPSPTAAPEPIDAAFVVLEPLTGQSQPAPSAAAITRSGGISHTRLTTSPVAAQLDPQIPTILIAPCRADYETAKVADVTTALRRHHPQVAVLSAVPIRWEDHGSFPQAMAWAARAFAGIILPASDVEAETGKVWLGSGQLTLANAFRQNDKDVGIWVPDERGGRIHRYGGAAKAGSDRARRWAVVKLLEEMGAAPEDEGITRLGLDSVMT